MDDREDNASARGAKAPDAAAIEQALWITRADLEKLLTARPCGDAVDVFPTEQYDIGPMVPLYTRQAISGDDAASRAEGVAAHLGDVPKVGDIPASVRAVDCPALGSGPTNAELHARSTKAVAPWRPLSQELSAEVTAGLGQATKGLRNAESTVHCIIDLLERLDFDSKMGTSFAYPVSLMLQTLRDEAADIGESLDGLWARAHIAQGGVL